jgi:hypothetical protein
MCGTKTIAFADDVITNKREVGERSGKYSKHRVKKSLKVGKRKQGPFQRPKFKSNVDDTSQKERKKGRGSIFKQQISQTN